MKEQTMEMRGMPRIEIINYFIGLSGEIVSETKIKGEGWEVEIDKEQLVALGSLRIPSTKVVLRCEEDIFVHMLGAFRLRFLSAGG